MSYDSNITSKALAEINKTQKRLVTKIDTLYNQSKKENEYVRLGEKISYTKLRIIGNIYIMRFSFIILIIN